MTGPAHPALIRLAPRQLLGSLDLKPLKQLGQNFLKDPAQAQAIVDQAGLRADEVVLEIGPGLGALTLPAALQARLVYAVDKDPKMLRLLHKQLQINQLGNVALVHRNILRLDLGALGKALDRRLAVLGSLPYNISSQIIVQLLFQRKVVDRALLILQKEMAQRICAPPGNKVYGRLSVMLQYCSRVRIVRELRPDAFYPRPKVASSVLEVIFDRTPRFEVKDEAFLFTVIKAAFGQRRKTLKNALTGHPDFKDKDQVVAALVTNGIDPRRRAETLSVQEFTDLSNHLWQK